MKKKGFIILGGIFTLAVMIVALGIIILSENSSITETTDLNGTWCVYQYAENRVENEFMVFDDGVVYDYRDGSNEPYISSAYTYENGTLKMSDVSKDFTVRIISDNNIILIEADTREWKMIRVAALNQEINAVTESDLVGEYNVVMLAGEPRKNETMIFTDSNLIDIRDGEEYLSCRYEMLSDHLLSAIDISKEYYVYKNGNVVLLIDKADGYVWELTAK